MTKPDEELDPRLSEALELLQGVPARDPEAAARGRAKFLAEADSLRRTVSYPPFWRLTRWINIRSTKEIAPMNWRFATLTTLALVVVVLTALFGGAVATTYASQGALPGDALYPVKTALEGARLALSRDAARDTELHLVFAQKRLDELVALIEVGRYDNVSKVASDFETQVGKALEALSLVAESDPVKARTLALATLEALSRYARALMDLQTSVPAAAQPAVRRALQASQHGMEEMEIEFTGLVKSMGSEVWVVDDRELTISEHTEIENSIVVGDLVRVEALMAADGSLTALEIKLVEEQAIDNENENENANENENENVNTNENENENDDADDNENEDGNANDNENENGNANDNENENGNENGEDDDNLNDNEHDEDDENDNDNDNDNNDDDEEYENENDNDND